MNEEQMLQILLLLFAVLSSSIVSGQPTFQIGPTECYSCGQGSYSSTDGSAQCTLCQAGYYAATTNNTGCLECPAGKRTLPPDLLAAMMICSANVMVIYCIF